MDPEQKVVIMRDSSIEKDSFFMQKLLSIPFVPGLSLIDIYRQKEVDEILNKTEELLKDHLAKGNFLKESDRVFIEYNRLDSGKMQYDIFLCNDDRFYMGHLDGTI